MKPNPVTRLLGLVGLAGLIAAPAIAQDQSYYYAGAGVGQSRANIDEPRITAGLLAGGLATTAFSRDESDTSYKLFGGYQFNRNFGVEGGYFDLGDFNFLSTTAPAGTLAGQTRMRGLNLDLVGTLPLSQNWSVLGRIGAQYARTNDNFSGTGAVVVLNPNPSAREANLKLGAGLQYEVNRSLLVRAEAERYRVNDAVGNHGGVNVFSLSLVFPLGRPAAQRTAAAQPAYQPAPYTPAPVVVAQQPPAPVVVAQQPPAPVVARAASPPVFVPPPVRRVSFSAESLFAFDRSELRPEGRIALDIFTKDLGGTQFDSISVVGHTDRLGSQGYNQKLSQQRADSVKDYLVSSGGVSASRIQSFGKGESMPLAKTQDCKGNSPSPSLIACLQPDRRVEVEVTGTR